MQQRRQRSASRLAPTLGGDQVPRSHALFRREVREKLLGLWPLQRKRAQADGSVPGQQAAEQPLAQAAVTVVQDPPALLAGLAGRASSSAEAAR